MEDLYKYEKELYAKGLNLIGGVDEVGRGPLIGSVVAACVVLPKDFVLEGLTDSKKLSEKKRNLFYDIIREKAITVGIGVEHVLIDAMPLDINVPTTSIIKGDAKSISIAAASVIAKVTRDKMMYELDKKYPMYDLKNNKGYGTKKHLEAIEKYGITKYHRLTFKPVSNYKDKVIN